VELCSILPICLDGECRDSINVTLTNTTTRISSSISGGGGGSSSSSKTQELLQTRSDPSSEFLGTIFHILYAPYLLVYRVSDLCMRLEKYNNNN
jgi:hypothetical protein